MSTAVVAASTSPAARRRMTAIGRVCATALTAITLGVLCSSALAATLPSDGCSTASNPVACENGQPGSPLGNWEVTGVGDPTIQGYATSMSVDVGQTISFKIDTPSTAYHIDVYRLGWYGGDGARLVASDIVPSASLPQTQPACITTTTTGEIDCGNWGVSASWAVPSTAVSGVYIAHLVRTDSQDPGGDSQIPFVVRNDASHSDILVPTSDATWEAYNDYGGNSLYTCTVDCPPGNPEGYKAAYAVSYNRPWDGSFTTDGGDSYLYYAEYQMILFLEQQGYNVSYTDDADLDSQPSLLLNHKLILFSGHDEYWSGNERANVLAARNAGVNLAFFTGNGIFWKTRWGNSIDGSNTAYRTLITYKETHFNAVMDPEDPPIWTGAWADPRFSPPADGGNPANALEGQMFVVNAGTSDITVPSTYSKLRLWQNTGVAKLAAGQSLTLGAGDGDLGYEWDVDADNGFRPAGELDLSSTTVSGLQAFTDYGTYTTDGTGTGSTQTHHLTLYRAPSGALVFGAGTVQWSWGLENFNAWDSPGTEPSGHAPDPNMQQFTVNLLAMMGVQPSTLESGLVAASTSTDKTPPSSTISSPSNGASIADGSAVTITGSATDTGGGVVAGVEVSADGGKSWHPATLTTPDGATVSWSYSWIAHGYPSTTIESRAVDDSANIETPKDAISVTITCPCSLWGTNVTPATVPFGVDDSGDASSVEVGVQFTTSINSQVTGIRFYKASTNTGTHVGSLWTSTGTLLAQGTFTNETASGWQTLTFSSPVSITPGTTYVAGYFAPNGHYSATPDWFYPAPAPTPLGGATDTSGPWSAVINSDGSVNGLYGYGTSTTFPTSTYDAENYWVDPIFSPTSGSGNTAPGAPTGVTASPASSQAQVSWIAPASNGGSAITSYSVTPYIAGTAQTPITGISASATSAVVSGLTNGTSYTFTVSATNTVGTGSASSPSSAVVPADTILDFGTPATLSAGNGTSINLGVKLTPSQNGNVIGIRFYKASTNTGTHVGTLWSSTGTQLAQVTFSGETASGWQTALFSSPVAVTAGTTYVASYLAPSGYYSDTANEFSSAVTNGPLTAPANGSVTPGNGLYLDAASSAFPTTSGGGTGYWVDVLFNPTTSGGTAPGAPTGVTAAPAGSEAQVSWTAPASSGSSSITSYTVTPYVGGAAQSAITGISPSVTSTIVTGLTNGTSYTFKVSASNAAGTGSASSASSAVVPEDTILDFGTPATVDSGDTSAVNLGVQFTPSQNGNVIGIRFYKASTNTGTHVGTLWSSTGTQLAQVTFSGETASGWQTALFSSPVAVTAGTTYVASYLAPAGHYSDTAQGLALALTNGPLTAPGSSSVATGNGVYAYGTSTQFPSNTYNSTDYWVDVLFNPTSGGAATAPGAPTSVTANPASSEAQISWVPPSNGGSAITSYTVTPYVGATAQKAITGISGAATSTVVSGLTDGTSYTFTVSATNTMGTGSASSASNAAVPEDTVLDFGTPGTVDSGDGSSVNIGMQFTPDEAGTVVGVRFYKASANTGTHIGTLWSATGTNLAQVTFSGESASGWQTALFSSPVSVTSGTTYVISYLAPSGHYSDTAKGLASAITNGPLTAPGSSSLTDGNGVYVYSTANAFPSNTYNATNYWVDVLFKP